MVYKTESNVAENSSLVIDKYEDIKLDLLLIYDKIRSIPFPDRWRLEGISPPTDDCKETTISTIKYIYDCFKIIPSRIAATIEEGLFFKYINKANGNELSIEIYNDLEKAAILTNNEDIKSAIDIRDNKEFDDIIKEFLYY
ncbi:MAG: hypothetical protein HQL05_10270 [Nitrospirae bacterium]|nr:hypothetical protein [Nitrospirota bacterium]